MAEKQVLKNCTNYYDYFPVYTHYLSYRCQLHKNESHTLYLFNTILTSMLRQHHMKRYFQ